MNVVRDVEIQGWMARNIPQTYGILYGLSMDGYYTKILDTIGNVYLLRVTIGHVYFDLAFDTAKEESPESDKRIASSIVRRIGEKTSLRTNFSLV